MTKNESGVSFGLKPAEDTEKEKDEITALADSLRVIQEAESVDEQALLKLSKEVEKLSPATQKAFLDSPIVSKMLEQIGDSSNIVGEDKPGTYKKFGLFSIKIPWKAVDLEQFPKIKYISENKKRIIIWNGITFNIPADEEVELPEPVYQIIVDQRNHELLQRRYEQYGYEGGVSKLQDGWVGKDAADKQG